VYKDMIQGESNYPISFNYVSNHDNPYENRYGADWRDEIKKVAWSGLTCVICVTDLIKHIDYKTSVVYKNTKYKKTYLWSHDALNQMCDKRCKQWMQDNGY
jgi:hypothetical protein